MQKYLDELLKVVNEALSEDISETNLRFNHFFSGAAAYVDEKIFCTYTPSGLAIKLPIKKIRKLITLNKGTKLRYFAKAPIKKDYIVLNNEIVQDTNELNYWIKIALDYVSTK